MSLTSILYFDNENSVYDDVVCVVDQFSHSRQTPQILPPSLPPSLWPFLFRFQSSIFIIIKLYSV